MTVAFNSVAFSVFGWPIHWYGITYLVGFSTAWALGRYRAGRPDSGWNKEEVDDWLFYVGLGVILGGRIGFILFYNLDVYLNDPILILKIWQGGMSFHGGLLGVMAGLWFFSRKYNKGYLQTLDFSAPLAPLALGAGRIGNFINGELWGAPSNLPWAMVFPKAPGDNILRHPTPLYEAMLEGLVLFVIIWWFSSRPRPTMAVAGLFAIGYAVFRTSVEFVRLPDSQLGYLAFGWVTMGMVLSLPVLIVGVFMMYRAYQRP